MKECFPSFLISLRYIYSNTFSYLSVRPHLHVQFLSRSFAKLVCMPTQFQEIFQGISYLELNINNNVYGLLTKREGKIS